MRNLGKILGFVAFGFVVGTCFTLGFSVIVTRSLVIAPHQLPLICENLEET